MPKVPSQPEEEFDEAKKLWNLEKLYEAMGDAEGKPLSHVQKRKLRALLEARSTKESARMLGISPNSLQQDFGDFYRCIEKVTLQPENTVTSRNIIKVLDESGFKIQSSNMKSDSIFLVRSDRNSIPTNNANIPPNTTSISFDLLGRDADRQKLTEFSQKHKLVLLKAAAGIGKSTLARHFLETQFAKVIRLEMGLESGNVTPAEEKISQILRKEFDEEPSRDFQTNLEILREKLADKSRPIGVLIDNLEPALDANFRFLDKLRGYEDLLRILGDRDVCSFTLITSRRSLIMQRVKAHEYSLQGLDIEAWREYFHDCENAATSEDLEKMRNAYNGNAKAMDVLHGAITERFDGNITAYWNRYKEALLADTRLETLISVEMDWLRDNQSDAYKLLCRMGCYRYQDVKTVPFEGLICLMWDIAESRRTWVIDYLSKTSLIEVEGGYYLHPAVRETAKSRLLNNKMEWERSNREAATYWTLSVKTIKDIDSNNQAFEAFYHYILINSFEEAARVLTGTRESGSEWEKLLDDGEHLAEANRRLAQHNKIASAIELVLPRLSKEMKEENLDTLFCTSILYKCWADNLWLSGEIHDALQKTRSSKFYTEQTLSIIEKYDNQSNKKKKLYLQRLLMMNLIDEIGCNYDLWEIQEAVKISRMVIEQCTRRHEFGYENYKIEASSYLSMCLSTEELESGQIECINLIDESLSCASTLINHWCSVHRLLFAGNSYKNIKHLSRAKELYLQSIIWTEEHKCHLNVKGEARSRLAEILRLQGNIDGAIRQHQKAINVLEKISAKCGLAEAYFQFGLTYQAMGEHDQAQAYKAKALELFAQMEAPKQIERVNKAFGENIQ